MPRIGIGGSLAAPPLPHHRTYGSVYGGSRGYANALRSKIQLVSAGRSGSCAAESDSMSSRPACRASPVGVDEKSSLNWMFSRLSLSRFHVLLASPLVRAFSHRFRFGLSVDSTFRRRSASLALPTTWPTMPSADFCPAVRMPHGFLSRRSDTEQISWGKFSRFPCTVAGSTLRILDGYGLRGKWPARPTLAPCTRCLSIDPHVCYTLPSDLASRR